MFTTISARRLSVGSIYKLWFIGLCASMIPIGLLFGVFALFGHGTVRWNNNVMHGFAGLIGAPLMGAFMALLLTGFLGTASALGLWVYSTFRPISLSVELPDGDSSDPHDLRH
jgi:hypothetical protein